MRKEVMRHERARVNFSISRDATIPEDTFRGVASVFGSHVEAYIPTVIERGAFTRTLAERTHKVVLLWQHDTDEPIGKPIELAETQHGLDLLGKISQTSRGKDALILLRDDVVSELSIGFDPIVWEMDTTDPKNPVRHIKELRLWEISLVTFAADPAAKISTVHNMVSDEERFTTALASVVEALSSSDSRQRLEACLKVNGEIALKAHGLIGEALSVGARPSSAPAGQHETPPEVTPDPGIAAARNNELVDALLWQPVT